MSVWSKTLMIGIEQIDDEHKMLIDKVDALYMAMKEGHGQTEIENTLNFLEKYVQEHFRHEEQIYKKYNYPGYEAHYKIHEQFKKDIRVYKQKILDSPITATVAIETNKILVDWLRKHIGDEDRKAGKYLLEHMQ